MDDVKAGVYRHKTCSDCREEKSLDDFPRNAQGRDGRHRYCNVCNRRRVKEWKAANPARIAAYEAANRARISERERRNRMLRKFGVTIEQYDAMLVAQGGGCAVCGATENAGRKGYLALDHDHTTGRIRGLLCDACNKVLGFVRDSPTRLRGLAEYVEVHRVAA